MSGAGTTTAAEAPSTGWPDDTCTASVPAHPDFVASLRGLVRSTAVLADLTLPEVEELQIATSEAAALLLPLTAGSGTMGVRVRVASGRLRVSVSVSRAVAGTIDRTSLGWMMLSTLCPDVEVDDDGDVPAVSFTHVSSPARGAS